MSLVFCLKSNNIANKIIKKNINSIKYDSKVNLSYAKIKQKLLTSNNKKYLYLFDSISFWSVSKIDYGIKILLDILNISNYNDYYINNNNIIKNNLFVNNNKNNSNTLIIKKIYKVRNPVFSKNTINYNELTIYFYNIIIKFIKSIQFKNNDNFIFTIYKLDITPNL